MPLALLCPGLNLQAYWLCVLILFEKSQQLRAESFLAVRVVQQCMVWHRHAEMSLGCSGIPEKEQLAVVPMPCFCY